MNPHMRTIEVAWQKPKHVFLNEVNLDRVAGELSAKEFLIPSWREDVFPKEDDAVFVQFLGVVNSINFCFTDFSTGKKFDVEYPEGSGKIYTGAYALTASIKRALDEDIPILDPYFLASLNDSLGEYIFRYKTTPIPMFNARMFYLASLGHSSISYKKISDFKSLFDSCDYRLFNNGNGIVEVLNKHFYAYLDEVFFYDAVCGYRFTSLIFSKRAQLFPMVYHGRALSSNGNLQPIKDPEHFGPIADYQVPRALRNLGVVSYSKELSSFVDNHKTILAGGLMEVEIRAQTVNAMQQLLRKINNLRSEVNKITMVELDYMIWLIGRKSKNTNHHYTYTTAY